MKKTILLFLIPFLCFSQNTKTDKVINQVNTAAGVASGVIGLFKKNKNKDNADNKADTKSNNKNTTNASSDGTFSVNAKPEDIVAKVLKCNPKNFYEEKYCVWKPDPKDFSNINNLFEDDKERVKYLINMMPTVATKTDTVITFNKNGVNNIVLGISSYSTDGDGVYVDCNACSALIGIIRLQADGQQMKLANLEKFLIEAGGAGCQKIDILNLDDDNVFYEIKESMAYKGGERYFTARYFDLNGNIVMRFNDDGYCTDYKTEIDRTNKTFKLIHNEENYNIKGKLIKSKKQIVATYQYGNGTITEIKQPVKTKTTTTKKK